MVQAHAVGLGMRPPHIPNRWYHQNLLADCVQGGGTIKSPSYVLPLGYLTQHSRLLCSNAIILMHFLHQSMNNWMFTLGIIPTISPMYPPMWCVCVCWVGDTVSPLTWYDIEVRVCDVNDDIMNPWWEQKSLGKVQWRANPRTRRPNYQANANSVLFLTLIAPVVRLKFGVFSLPSLSLLPLSPLPLPFSPPSSPVYNMTHWCM